MNKIPNGVVVSSTRIVTPRESPSGVQGRSAEPW